MLNKARRLLRALAAETLRRIPYIIVLAIVLTYAALWLSYEKTAQTLQATKANTAAINKSVQDLKADNQNQTKILCRIILKGTVGQKLTPTEAAQVEKICKEAIADTQNTAASSTPPAQASNSGTKSGAANTSTPPKTTGSSSSAPAGNDTDTNVGTNPPPAPSPGIIQQTTDFLSGIIKAL